MSGHRDDGAAVEFILVTDVTADEELLEPPASARTTLARRLAVGAAVAVLAAALIVRTATSRQADRQAQPRPAEPTSMSLQQRLEALGGGEISRANIPGLADCLTLSCNINTDLPPTFLVAVRERLGQVVATEQIDVTTGDEARTWYRRLSATSGKDVTIVLTVSKTLASRVTTTGLKLTADSVTAYVTHPTGDTGYSVQIQVSGPVDWVPPQDAIAALASDPRLVAGG